MLKINIILYNYYNIMAQSYLYYLGLIILIIFIIYFIIRCLNFQLNIIEGVSNKTDDLTEEEISEKIDNEISSINRYKLEQFKEIDTGLDNFSDKQIEDYVYLIHKLSIMSTFQLSYIFGDVKPMTEDEIYDIVTLNTNSSEFDDYSEELDSIETKKKNQRKISSPDEVLKDLKLQCRQYIDTYKLFPYYTEQQIKDLYNSRYLSILLMNAESLKINGKGKTITIKNLDIDTYFDNFYNIVDIIEDDEFINFIKDKSDTSNNSRRKSDSKSDSENESETESEYESEYESDSKSASETKARSKKTRESEDKPVMGGLFSGLNEISGKTDKLNRKDKEKKRSRTNRGKRSKENTGIMGAMFSGKNGWRN